MSTSSLGSKSLVSFLSGELQPGLTTLQEMGVTPQIWKRMILDREFRDKVAEAIKEADQNTKGDRVEISWDEWKNISPWDIREDMYEKILGKNHALMALRKDIVYSLSSGGTPRCRNKDGTVFTQTKELFLTHLYRSMSLEEALEELKRRRLAPALTEEALNFFIHYQHLITYGVKIFVLGAQTEFGLPHGPRTPHFLDFGVTGDGTRKIGLWEVDGDSKVLLSGCRLLTKRAR